MANVKAKALSTIAVENGTARTGEEIVLVLNHAKELEAKGLVEIIGEDTESDTGKKGVKMASDMRTSNVTDNTGKPTEPAEKETGGSVS